VTKPDIGDILSGVQRLLQGELVPALAEQPFLAEQAMYATLILEYCKKAWPRVHLAFVEEHRDLCDTLRGVALELARDAETAGFAATLREALERHACDPAVTPLDVVAERSRALREHASRTVELLSGRDDGSPARRALDAYLARLAARQRAELDLLGIAW